MLKGAQIRSFELVELLGIGGMGQVWRARHVTERVDVAIKCLTIDLDRDSDETEDSNGFMREVYSLAQLQHPNIAAILDMGSLDRDLEPLRRGSPYMVMEYVGGSHLRRTRNLQQWPWLYRILSQLLEALAHSHSRGVIHRDLKPSNILLTPKNDLKLVDFGIARALDAEQRNERTSMQASGTPKYMAPEQFTGEGRVQGPWTDLYALGCLAWELATGAPPFVGNLYELMTAHSKRRPDSFTPLFEVPHGFERWLQTLLAKDPRARFRRAADALQVLETLHDSEMLAVEVASAIDEPSDEHIDEPTMQLEAPATVQLDAVQALARDMQRPTEARARHEYARPPIAPDWRVKRSSEDELSWSSFGEGLWGLFSLPMVGRERERDRLWAILRACAQDRLPNVVLIEGALGQGKSHLTSWFASRAHEVGAAHILRAEHSAQGTSRDGILPMFDLFFDTYGMTLENKRAHLERTLPIEFGVDPGVLASALTPDADGNHLLVDTSEHRFIDIKERDAVWTSLLVQLAEERPVIVLLEDVHMAADALRFAKSFLDRKLRSPILFVLTAEPTEGSNPALEQVMDAPFSAHIKLANLGHEDMLEIFTRGLGLEQRTAAQLIDRAGGKIVSALQLLGHWLEQNHLRKTSRGLELESEAIVLSEDLMEILSVRLEHLYAKIPDAPSELLQRQLELATALGREVLMSEWDAVCHQLFGVPGNRALVSLLVKHNLAAHRIDGWAFTHEMLCDCLEQRARGARRWKQAHEAIVDALDGRGIERVRLARHQRLAQRYPEAIDSLVQAARRAFYFGEVQRVRGMLEQMAPMITELSLPDEHPSRMTYRILLSRWERLTGAQTDATRERLERVVKRCRWDGLDEELGAALLALAQVLENENRLDDAIAAVEEGVPVARSLEDPEMLTTFLMRLGMYLNWTGRAQEAMPHLEEARQLSDHHRLMLLQVHTRHKLGHVLPSLGEPARAKNVLEEALAMANALGSPTLRASTYNMLGNLATSMDDRFAARVNYERAASLHEGVIERAYLIAQCNLGRLDVREEKWADCEERMRPVFERSVELNLHRIQIHAVIPLIFTTSLKQDLTDFEHFMDAFDEVQNNVVSESTSVELLHKTAMGLVQRGEKVYAARALEHLGESYKKIGDAERGVEVLQLLAAMKR